MNPLTGRRWWLASGLVLAMALCALAPTAGDFGLTYDEPAYRYSQLVSVQWWERLARARSGADLAALVEPDALLYYWPYARHGINFHPPLAGQLNLLTYELFGSFVQDIPARRLASVFEFALTIALLFGFLSKRYGGWVGGMAAASLLLMPRLYGQAHLIDTDTPGLLLWAATALAFWKGLHEPAAGGWRILVGVLLGLAFVEKMGAVMVLLPLLIWLVAGHLPRTFRRGGGADWIDGLVTSALMLAPLGLAYREILRLGREFLKIQARMGVPLSDLTPARTNLFRDHPEAAIPGVILAAPLAVWLARRLLRWTLPRHRIWGVERPALEVWTAVLAFAPVVGWLGNPAWWRETLPRLAHYHAISTARRGVLPDIQILYFGQAYEYSLPWHNAWVLIAITVPAGILAAGLVGIVYALRNLSRDRVPLYFLVHLAALPALRMLPVPAHDGVRLFLPTFFFLAAMAGWGVVWLADGLAGPALSRFLPPPLRSLGWASPVPSPPRGEGQGEGAARPVGADGARAPLDRSAPSPPSLSPQGRGGEPAGETQSNEPPLWGREQEETPPPRRAEERRRGRSIVWVRAALSALVLGPAAWQLVAIHPFELSYYNELIGGPRGAWRAGFELSYWYDAFDAEALAELNRRFPTGAQVDFLNEKSAPVMVFQDLQSLDKLRGDLVLGAERNDAFPYVWLLTHDSKASAFSRYLFAMRPWYARTPSQLGGLRVATVADPAAISRAWALQLLTDAPDRSPPEPPPSPDWVRSSPALSWLGRFWGEGVTKVHRLTANEATFAWAKSDPASLRAAAVAVASRRPIDDDPDALRLRSILTGHGTPAQGRAFLEQLLRARPEGLVEAAEILTRRPDAVRRVLLRYPYTDPADVGGYLDDR